VSGAFQEIGEPRPRAPYLSVAAIPNDDELIDVVFATSNELATAYFKHYGSFSSLTTLADSFAGFPRDTRDARVVRHEAMRGHAIEFRLAVTNQTRCFALVSGPAGEHEEECWNPSGMRTTVAIPFQFDPAALNDFVAALRRLAAGEYGRAVLHGRRE
jgi:hypothetical protein